MTELAVEVPTPTTGVAALTRLRALVQAGDAVVLTGAGISTESGIPDYRGATGRLRPATPITYQSFVGDAAARHRYWARGFLGWHKIAAAQPNAGHVAVAAWQRAGWLRGLVTQNVDGLHQAAGARNVVELHGGLDRTVCLACGDRRPRAELDARLRAANPDFAEVVGAAKPDGDVDLPAGALARFVCVGCAACGSDLLKPDVVFFGENVPPERVRHVFELVAAARSVIVLGSSLTVFSGYRFVRAAHRAGIAVAIVNQGPTRADAMADVRIDGPLGEVLPALTHCDVA